MPWTIWRWKSMKAISSGSAPRMAIAILGALPLLLAFVLFQRQIVQGIANTGLKG